MEGITPNGNIDYVVELLAGLVEEGRPPTREQIREHCESLCRAQVRNVVEWARTNCLICADSYPYDAETALFNWQALRAAGEGK